MIKDWLKNAQTTAIQHDASEPTPQPERYARARRMATFAAVAGLSVVMAASGVLNIANNTVQAAELVSQSGPVATQQVPDAAANNPVRAQIQSLMGEHSHQLDHAVGHDKLVVVSQQDQNLPTIVQSLSSDLVPGITISPDAKISPDHSDVQNHMIAKAQEMAGQSSESMSKALYAEFARINDKDAHADFMTNTTTGQRVCYVKVGYDASHWQTGRGLPFQMQDAEMQVAVTAHELAHCQDFNEVKVRDGNGNIKSPIHQMEVIADMTAALMITSKTGNWDYVDHTLIPFRTLDRTDIDHETSGWIQSMREQVDVGDLKPMNQHEAFDMAQKLYGKMDYSQLRTNSFIDFKVDGMYRAFMEHGKDPVPGIMNRGYLKEAKGVETEADAMNVVQQHGETQLGIYLNHIHYRSLQKDANVVPALLAEMGKHAEAFGNTTLNTAVQQQAAQWEQHGTINLQPLAKSVGAELNHVGMARFSDNGMAVAELGQQLGLNTGKTPTLEVPGSVIADPQMNAYERFRERFRPQPSDPEMAHQG